MLKNVRLSFPNLYEASAFQEGQDLKFSATVLLPKGSPQAKELEDEIQRVAVAKWDKKAEAILMRNKANLRLKNAWDGDYFQKLLRK